MPLRAASTFLVGILLTSCAPPPIPTPAAAPASNVVVSASAAPPRAPDAPEPAAARKRKFVVEKTPLVQDIDEDTGSAPCDFSRSYRGKVGETPVTLLLRKGPSSKPDALEGFGHYDRLGPSIELSGKRVEKNGFVVSERSGGTFEGTCNTGGALVGTFSFNRKKIPFDLKPRPASWPGLYRVQRRATAEPNHPLCKKKAKADQPIETSETDDGPRIICLPTRPAARKALLADGDHLLCTASEASYRVFGMPDRNAEKRANDTLTGVAFDLARNEIASCRHPHQVFLDTTLLWAQQDLLVFTGFRSEDFGGAHPLNNGGRTTVIDLRDGSALALEDLVETSRLRPAAEACLPYFGALDEDRATFEIEGELPPVLCGKEQTPARYLWGCDPDDIKAPVWTLLPAGVVIGGWANPHARAADDGRGPILPWSILLRDGILKSGSRVSHLWAGVQPAARSALSCTSALGGSSVVTWREDSSTR
jgi:hypothetical protein